MVANWIQSQLTFHAPALWLLLSLISGGLLWLLGWLFPQWPLARLQRSQWILIPYLGLILGGLSPRLMGLVDVDWLVTLELGFGLFFALFLLIVLVKAISASSPTSSVTFSDISAAQIGTTALVTTEKSIDEALPTLQWQPVFFDLLWSGTKEFHWSFLRGAVWELLLFAPFTVHSPAYWAIWVAALLALPSIFTRNLQSVQILIQFVLLIATSILFFYTRNFWLCWALHAVGHFILMPQNNPHNYTIKQTNLHY